MKHYKLRIPLDVELLIDAQVLYIAEDSIPRAIAWEIRLRAAIKNLVNTPALAIDPDASERVGMPVRKMVFERTYLIFYIIDEAAATLSLINFRHGARRPRDNES